MHQYRYTPEHEAFSPGHESSGPVGGTQQDRLGNAAIASHQGLNGSRAISDAEAMDWLGDGADLAPDAATEDGPATIEVVATSPTPTADPASETPQDASDFHALDEHAQAAHALRLEVEGLQNNASGHASMEGAAAFGSSLESVELMSSFGDAGSGVSESMTSDYDEYMASQQEAINNAVVLMSVDEKKHSLREIGYSSSTIGQMSGSELDDALSGTLTSHVRFLKIQGMSAVELAQLPVNEQRQFLTDLGVPAADLWKAKDRYIRDAVQQVVAKSKTPGNHSIRLKIRGGFFRKKSYDIQLEVSNEGHLAGVDIEKKGGFFSKLGGFIKTALPIVAKLLAGVTGGLSLVALGIYQGIEAARKGDWVGVITSVAGGLGAAGLDTISRVANGINKAASAAQAGLNAIQAKNPGGILAAISSGAGALAGAAADQAGKFATKMSEWSGKLASWGNITDGAMGTIAAVKGRDPLLALDTALTTVTQAAGASNESTGTRRGLYLSQKMSGFAQNARTAIQSKPPQYGALASSAFSMAGELRQSGKLQSAERLTSAGQALQDAILSKDPNQLAQAVLGMGEAIEMSQAPDGETQDEKTARVGERYRKSRVVASASLGIVNGVQSGEWDGVIRSSADLVTELSQVGMVDSAANITRLSLDVQTALATGNAALLEASGELLVAEIKDVYRAAHAEDAPVELEEPLPPLPSTPLKLNHPILLPSVETRKVSLMKTEKPLLESTSLDVGLVQAPSLQQNINVSMLVGATETTLDPARILDAQRTLNEWSDRFDMNIGLDVDGILGPKTEAALRSYQAAYPTQLQVTGTLDKTTQVHLQNMGISIAYEEITNPRTRGSDGKANAEISESPSAPTEVEQELHEMACCLEAVKRASASSESYPKDVTHHFELLKTMELALTPRLKAEAQRFKKHYEQHQSIYQRVAQRTGLPAPLIAAIHWRESSGNFSKSIQDGKSDVPANVWEDHASQFLNDWNGGYNDLAGRLGLDADTDDLASMAAFAERYNGMGYRPDPSPYVYNGANHGEGAGKYAADGEYREDHVDQQPGVVPLLAVVGSSQTAPELLDGPIGKAFSRIAGSPASMDARFNKTQLTHYLEHVLGYPNDGMFKGIKRGKTADTIIEDLDTDKDGWVTWTEFTAITQSLYELLVDGKPMSELTPEAIRRDAGAFFDGIPGSEDGLLSLDELQEHAESLVPDDTEHRDLVAQLMARLTIDVLNQDEGDAAFNDRTISRDEWLDAVTEIAPSVL